MNEAARLNREQDRVLSIDFFRGFTMFMLVTGIATLFRGLVAHGKGGAVVAFIDGQLEHAPWTGLNAWDLIQPFFMFIVGVAMPFSFSKRLAAGDSWNKALRHALNRSFWLLVLGFMLGAGEKSYDLTNVLAQLSVTYLIAFLLLRAGVRWQLLVSFAMILLNDLLYRLWSVPGFDQPFTPDHNFGSYARGRHGLVHLLLPLQAEDIHPDLTQGPLPCKARRLRRPGFHRPHPGLSHGNRVSLQRLSGLTALPALHRQASTANARHGSWYSRLQVLPLKSRLCSRRFLRGRFARHPTRLSPRVAMKLWISRNADVPVREQLSTQIILAIRGGEPPGEALGAEASWRDRRRYRSHPRVQGPPGARAWLSSAFCPTTPSRY